MTRARNVFVVIGCALLAACGGNSTGNGPDAPLGTADAKPGNPDAPILPGGVAVIPLQSPDGSFYTAQVGVGAQQFAMIVDTGSTTTAVAGQSCSACGVNPRYMPGSTAADQHQTANAQYGSGSWNGEIYQDKVGLGAGTPQVSVKIASITSQQTFFDPGNSFQGLLGLGSDQLLTQGTTSYLDALVQTGVTDVQAFQLCDSGGGTMWLGGYDPAATAQAPQYTPMDAQLPYYAVKLQDMKLGTTSIGYTSTSAVADTGTSLFYVPKAAANGVLAQANKATDVFASQFTSQQGIYCAMAKNGVTSTQIDAALPPLTMTFPSTSGGTFTISAPATRSYLLDGGGGLWCIGVQDNSQLFGLTLMGDVGLRGFVTIFDRVNHRVGFAPEQGCSATFRQRTTPVPLRERGHLPQF